jgi:phage-related protein
MRYFETVFLEEAHAFIAQLDSKTVRKIFYVIDLAEQTNDPKLLKKIQQDIWEFRANYAGLQIRLLAFWDKTDNSKTLVVATHGFIKKSNRVPKNELARALRLREKYYINSI